MDPTINTFNTYLKEIEVQLERCSKLIQTDFDRECLQIEAKFTKFENELARFQMRNGNKYKAEIDDFEEKMLVLKASFDHVRGSNRTSLGQSLQSKVNINESHMATDQQMISRGELAINESRQIALGMLKTADKIREEINMIEDEVMLQREKLIFINQQLKETQDINFQTRKLVNRFLLSIKQDVFIKILIVLVSIALLSVIVMGIIIRYKQSSVEITKLVKNLFQKKSSDQKFNDHDLTTEKKEEYETRFLNLGYLEVDFLESEDPLFLYDEKVVRVHVPRETKKVNQKMIKENSQTGTNIVQNSILMKLAENALDKVSNHPLKSNELGSEFQFHQISNANSQLTKISQNGKQLNKNNMESKQEDDKLLAVHEKSDRLKILKQKMDGKQKKENSSPNSRKKGNSKFKRSKSEIKNAHPSPFNDEDELIL